MERFSVVFLPFSSKEGGQIFRHIERASGRWIYDVYVFIVRSTRYKRLANVEYECGAVN